MKTTCWYRLDERLLLMRWADLVASRSGDAFAFLLLPILAPAIQINNNHKMNCCREPFFVGGLRAKVKLAGASWPVSYVRRSAKIKVSQAHRHDDAPRFSCDEIDR